MNQRKGGKLSTLANDQLLPREELYKRTPEILNSILGYLITHLPLSIVSH